MGSFDAQGAAPQSSPPRFVDVHSLACRLLKRFNKRQLAQRLCIAASVSGLMLSHMTHAKAFVPWLRVCIHRDVGFPVKEGRFRFWLHKDVEVALLQKQLAELHLNYAPHLAVKVSIYRKWRHIQSFLAFYDFASEWTEDCIHMRVDAGIREFAKKAVSGGSGVTVSTRQTHMVEYFKN